MHACFGCDPASGSIEGSSFQNDARSLCIFTDLITCGPHAADSPESSACSVLSEAAHDYSDPLCTSARRSACGLPPS